MHADARAAGHPGVRGPAGAAKRGGTGLARPSRMRTRQTLAALILLGSAACGDDVDHTRCTLTMSLTGDITASTPKEIDCSANYDGPLLVMTFEPLEDAHHPLGTFVVWLDEVGKGQTGEFPATALVISPEGWVWETDACSVTITKYAYSGRPCENKGLFQTDDDPTCDGYDVYRIIGHGVCDATAVQSNGEGAIDIGSFEFVTRLWWPR